MKPALFISALLLFLNLSASATTLYVQAERGDDAAPGTRDAPLRTLKRAVSLAQPGYTIELLPHDGPIRQSLAISNRSGEPGNPITFEGNGQTLSGQAPLNANDWERVRPGLYRSKQLPKVVGAPPLTPLIRRFYFLFDGKIQRMGIAHKGARSPQSYKPVADLQPGEWTWQADEKAFYVAIEPDATLETARVAAPVLANGVATNGRVFHWVIRNLAVEHVLNDGFNLHGESGDLHFENISARECGDDGMSAHGTCALSVDGFTSRGNATGICHIDASQSDNRNVVLEGNIGFNLYLLGTGTHRFRESRLSTRDGGIRLGSKGKQPGEKVTVDLTGCEFPGLGEPGTRLMTMPEHTLLTGVPTAPEAVATP